jgi:hypothetical protein
VWGALKEQILRKVFATLSQLEKYIIKERRKFLKEKCAKMMDTIPYRLQLVIENNGEQIHKY